MRISVGQGCQIKQIGWQPSKAIVPARRINVQRRSALQTRAAREDEYSSFNPFKDKNKEVSVDSNNMSSVNIKPICGANLTC